MNLLGIDGCRAGWVVARSDEALRWPAFTTLPNLESVFHEAATGPAVVAIDIPIGLSDDGARGCDIEARRLLGFPRNTSVFAAPCRGALGAGTFVEACALNRAARGTGVSIELFNILPKIAEVDRLITPALQERVREAHPEVVFATLAGTGRGLLHAKRTPAGEAERLALLAPYFSNIDPGVTRAELGRRWVARDDIVDALACLVTAHRVWRGEARVLPEGRVELDGQGLRMEIVA